MIDKLEAILCLAGDLIVYAIQRNLWKTDSTKIPKWV